jgi:hypothetical protein
MVLLKICVVESGVFSISSREVQNSFGAFLDSAQREPVYI